MSTFSLERTKDAKPISMPFLLLYILFGFVRTQNRNSTVSCFFVFWQQRTTIVYFSLYFDSRELGTEIAILEKYLHGWFISIFDVWITFCLALVGRGPREDKFPARGTRMGTEWARRGIPPYHLEAWLYSIQKNTSRIPSSAKQKHSHRHLLC